MSGLAFPPGRCPSGAALIGRRLNRRIEVDGIVLKGSMAPESEDGEDGERKREKEGE